MKAQLGKACMAVLDWAPPAKYVIPAISLVITICIFLAFF